MGIKGLQTFLENSGVAVTLDLMSAAWRAPNYTGSREVPRLAKRPSLTSAASSASMAAASSASSCARGLTGSAAARSIRFVIMCASLSSASRPRASR